MSYPREVLKTALFLRAYFFSKRWCDHGFSGTSHVCMLMLPNPNVAPRQITLLNLSRALRCENPCPDSNSLGGGKDGGV
ncbi:hypothetical protein VTI74DRAFT_7787 [Chaetomium olivicolor]